MLEKKSARLPALTIVAVILMASGVAYFQQRENRASQARALSANADFGKNTGVVETPSGALAIPAFKQWAEASAGSALANAEESKGMALATARAVAMKELIRQDPAAALRECLPAELRASLPPSIAMVIEQPVEKMATVSIRMMCDHSADSPHGNCEATPVLLEELDSWNAHYGDQEWRSHLGQDVEFVGVAVDREVAVRSITRKSLEKNP